MAIGANNQRPERKEDTGMQYLRKMAKGEKGQTMVEYALILAAIAVVLIAGYTAIGAGALTTLGTITAAL